MKCPRCQSDNYEGARFCTGCGCMMPKESRVRKFFMAALHAFLYVALFMGIQTIVMFAYSFALGLSAAIGLYRSGSLESYDPELLLQELAPKIYTDLHTVMILSGLITVLALVISFRIRHKDAMKEMHVTSFPLIRAPWCVVLGISLQPVTNFLLGFLPEEWLNNFAETNTLNYTTGPIGIELLNVVILTPILEELIFRGLAFTRLRRGMSTAVAVLISAAFFGAVHGHLVSFIYASVLGVVLAWLMLKNNNSVIAPILCHAGFNGGSYLVNILFENTENELLVSAVLLSSLSLLILSLFMTFRPIPEKE